MSTDKKRLILRFTLAMLITGLLVFAVVGGYCVHEELDYARGNEYAREHLAEHIRFTLVNNALPVTLKSLVFAQIPFWLTEFIGKRISADKKKLTVFQIIVTPVISAAVFIVLLVVWILTHFTLTF